MPVFPVTRWTLIVAAGLEGSEEANQAIAELCQTYWFPIYAFIRRLGNAPDEAEDLTQEFFAFLLQGQRFAYADRAKGRFRSFLLTSVRNFVRDQADRRNSNRRGGRHQVVPLELDAAERRYSREMSDRDTPEKLFEKLWAGTLMARVNEKVRVALDREGHSGHFHDLQRFLPGSDVEQSYTEVAAKLGITEGALKVAVHRLRRRYRDIFRAEIANLVSAPDQIEEEIRYLLEVLRG